MLAATIDSKQRISLVPHIVAQQIPQLSHVASCGWWRGVPTWTHHHNSPHGRVVVFVVPQCVALDLFLSNI